MSASSRFWAAVIWRLSQSFGKSQRGVISAELFDLTDDPVGDPMDRARFATVNGERCLFIRNATGWLRFAEMDSSQFGGDHFQEVAEAPPCEVRAEQMRRLVEQYEQQPSA